MVVLAIILAFAISVLALWGITKIKPTKQDLLLIAVINFLNSVLLLCAIAIKDRENIVPKENFSKESTTVVDIDYGQNFFKCIDKVERFEYDGQVYIKFTKGSDFEIVPDLIEYD
jgi:hypothetical protein